MEMGIGKPGKVLEKVRLCLKKRLLLLTFILGHMILTDLNFILCFTVCLLILYMMI